MERTRAPARPQVVDEPVGEFPQKRAADGDEAEGRAVKVRPAAVAGSWYYGDRQRLERYLDELLAAAPKPSVQGDVVALVSPHAGFSFSGKAAAAGFRLLRGRQIRRVVVLAVSHRVPFHGASIAEVTHYATPLGRIPLDLRAVAALRRHRLVGSVAQAHRQEHSLEMQLPLLQRVLGGGFTLVPLLLSRMEAGDHAALAAALAPLWDRHTLVVASSDFTHRGPNYSYEVPRGEGSVKERLAAVDDTSLAKVLARDRAGLLAHAARSGSTICGLHPVALLLELLGRVKGVKGQLVARYTSGDVTGDWGNTVTYLDVAFTAPLGDPATFPAAAEGLARARNAGASRFPLTGAEKAQLLRLARQTLEASVKRGRFAGGPLGKLELTASLRRKAGAFVTLKCALGPGAVCKGKGEGLRGCIGTIAPLDGVAETVAQRAASAALEDPRFPGHVSPAELPHIRVEVSVLTPPRQVKSAAEIVIGRHGIILRGGGRSATFLPQVAPEQGWDRETTLEHLARKAGLGRGGWRDPGTRFQVYEAIVFSEAHGDQGRTP